jgi:hypothetical protein
MGENSPNLVTLIVSRFHESVSAEKFSGKCLKDEMLDCIEAKNFIYIMIVMICFLFFTDRFFISNVLLRVDKARLCMYKVVIEYLHPIFFGLNLFCSNET